MIRSLSYINRKVKKSSNNFKLGEKEWIDIYKPTNNEVKKINKLTGIYIDDLKRAMNAQEFPRLVNRKNYSMAILRSINSKTQFSSFGIFISKKFILTVHSKKVLTIEELFESFQKGQGKELFSNGTTYIFCRIASLVGKKFQSELDKIDDVVDKLEDDILDGNVEKPSKIYTLKDSLMSIKKSLIANRNLIDMISGGYSKNIDSKKVQIFSELKMELNQIVSFGEMSRERLTGTMDMYMSGVSNRLNDIMKGFTVIASLLLLPMLISGIWGMNFANIPFFDHEFGFFIPLIIMLICVTMMGLWFKKKKWM